MLIGVRRRCAARQSITAGGFNRSGGFSMAAGFSQAMENKRIARDAVAHTRSILSNLPVNNKSAMLGNPVRRIHERGMLLGATTAVHDALNTTIGTLREKNELSSFLDHTIPGQNITHRQYIRKLEQLGRKWHYGTCETYAAVTFIYLLETGISPIDFVVVDYGDGSNHAFVAVRRERSDEEKSPKGGMPKFDNWDRDCAIADAWWPGNYSVSDVSGSFPKFGLITRFQLFDRAE